MMKMHKLLETILCFDYNQFSIENLPECGRDFWDEFVQ
ncbi:Uncharacterized protein BM_BM14800 [Brugia malayi]|uniref:Bm14800 n=1 Tax=Brugia malayi TaxID=6279 RepID=A0A0K0J1R8_BRUMA|nr:Uncharacterized protein BM_BM14800 [Brugia malayi]CDQ06076.1 Bm14800 [Brugia malayi]VIO87774.1 Uncharacterized protein BM_BM14800 [Brugia malayi]